MKNILTILAYSLFSAAALFFVEQSVGVSYALKTALKICLFLVVPLAYSRLRSGGFANPLRGISLKSVLSGVFVGVASFLAVIVAYRLLSASIDLAGISTELEMKLGITALNFIFIGLYIMFVNSLLEEYFFRNIVLLGILREGRRLTAYLYSSILFSLYHMSIFMQWFEGKILFLSLFGLFVIGIIYSYMNEKSGHFVSSWIAHAIADMAIITIGLRMFGII